MVSSRSLGIDAEYYIRNLLVPPLSRIFNLVGADVEHWYDSMPRTKRVKRYDLRDSGKMRIDSHFKSSHCVICGIDSNTSERHRVMLNRLASRCIPLHPIASHRSPFPST